MLFTKEKKKKKVIPKRDKALSESICLTRQESAKRTRNVAIIKNPSLCSNLLHIIGKCQYLTDEDTFCALLRMDTIVRKACHLGLCVHVYTNKHQVCPGMFVVSQAGWPGVAHHGVNKLPWPWEQREHIQPALWEWPLWCCSCIWKLLWE